MQELKLLFTNKYIYVPVLLWLSIQIFKVIWDLIETKQFNFKRIMGAGGMPSSHSAVVTSLATLIGKYQGVDSPVFALAVIFALVVMYDAAGLRRVLPMRRCRSRRRYQRRRSAASDQRTRVRERERRPRAFRRE